MVKITNVGVIEKEIAMTFGISEHADKNIVLVQNRKKHMKKKKHVAEFSDFEKAYESIQKLSEMLIMLGCTLMVIRFSI